jgi:hypothetical protein
MNGAATNNLQATTVPTNGGAATYTGRLLGSKEGQNLCRIFWFLESESNFTL